MIFDCFLYAGEADMLATRLHELEHVVDWFVVVEAAETFQGGKRDTSEIKHPKVLHVIADLPSGDAWTREAAQREQIRDGLDMLHAGPYDTIVLSDVDEIWSPSVPVSRLPGPFSILELRMYVYNFGFQHPDPWPGPVVCKVKDLPPASLGTFQALRSVRLHPKPHRVPNAGWHLSWFGGSDARTRKLRSFSHTEFAHVDMDGRADRGVHIDGTILVPVADPDVPAYAYNLPGWWP